MTEDNDTECETSLITQRENTDGNEDEISSNSDDAVCETSPNNEAATKSRASRLTLLVIIIVNIGQAVIISIQAPFYPGEAEKKHATATEYGLVFGIFQLTVFIVSPIFGKLIIKTGPNLMLNGGIFTSSISCIVFGLLTYVEGRTAFIVSSCVVRALEALGQAAYITGSFSLIIQEFPDRTATVFAAAETSFGVGLLIGPAIGGGLFQVGGYTAPFAVLGGFIFLAAIVIRFLLPDEKTKTAVIPSHGVISVLKVFPVLLSAMSAVAGASAIGFLAAVLEPHVRSFRLSPIINGLLFIIAGGAQAISAPLWGRLCDRFSWAPQVLMAVAAGLVVFGFALLGPAPFLPFDKTLWLVIVSLAVAGVGTSGEIVCGFLNSVKAATRNGYPDDLSTHGLLSGLWSSSFALGAFVGPSLAGALMDLAGFRMASLYVIVEHLLLVLLIVAHFLMAREDSMTNYRSLSDGSVANAP